MGWMDKYEDGGFLGTTNKGFNYNGAWGGPAQNGGEINQQYAENAFVSQRDWMSSPMYDRMLRKSTVNDAEYNKINIGRLTSLDKAGFEPNIQVLPNGSLGEAYPEGNIKISPLGKYKQSVYDHELSHATDTSRQPNGEIATYIPESDIALMKSLKRAGLKDDDYTNYLSNPSEVRARINAIRSDAKDRGIYDPHTEKMNRKHYKEASSHGDISPFLDLEEIYGKRKALKLINTISDTSPVQPNDIAQNGIGIPGSVGFSYARTGAPSNGKYAKKTLPSAESGVVVDDNGYWNPDNWGKVVEIGSNNITMKGINQPLLGISDTGDKKVMKPGKNYNFKGSKVTEYPMIKNGGELTKLDQLTNFTNYNKPQPGGWLDNL